MGIRRIVLILCMVAITLWLTACQGSGEVDADFAHPMAEEVLRAINEGTMKHLVRTLMRNTRHSFPRSLKLRYSLSVI